MDTPILIGLVVGLAVVAAFFLFGGSKKAKAVPAAIPTTDDEGVDEFMPPPDNKELGKIPKLSVRAGPRDGEDWVNRVKQELNALMKYKALVKATDSDWFNIAPSDATCTKWKGKCWYMFEMVKYEFDVEFEIPVTYPTTPFEIVLPELDGKTVKMYRGGKICLSAHFKPLWGKNVPHFGIAHALSMGLAPWLAAEVPNLIFENKIMDKKK